jgi:hypothetical protein
VSFVVKDSGSLGVLGGSMIDFLGVLAAVLSL